MTSSTNSNTIYPGHYFKHTSMLEVRLIIKETKHGYRGEWIRNMVMDSEKMQPLVLLKIQGIGHKSPSVQTYISPRILYILNDLLEAERNQKWILYAASFRHAKELAEKANTHINWSGNEVPGSDYIVTHREEYWQALNPNGDIKPSLEGFENSDIPCELMDFSADLFPNVNSESILAGSRLIISYIPTSKRGVKMKRPWVFEIEQYSLTYAGSHICHKERLRKQHIQLSSDEMKAITEILSSEYENLKKQFNNPID